jgi:CDP-diacylglycerol--glycerol-3-phosphate 3-phosphatidyltransferase
LPRFWNVPNTLTVGRLGLALLLFGLIEWGAYGLAMAAFVAAAITDALDGYFARLLNQDTPLGRQLDPLVDKVIVCGSYIYLLAIPDTGISAVMVVIIVVRELLIQGLRSLLEGQGHPFGAKTLGKLKMIFQCVSITAILLCLELEPPRDSPLRWIRDASSWTAVILTLWSGLGYLRLAMPRLRAEGSTPR